MSIWDNQALVDLLCSLWDEGRTGTEIANTIEVRFEILVTRNAVMAKLDRLGKLKSRPGGSGLAGMSRAQVEARKKKISQTKAAKAIPEKPAPVKSAPEPQGWFAVQSKPKLVEPYIEREARWFNPAKLVTFDQLDAHHCRMPVGDPRDTAAFRFCGEAKMIGISYCGKCAELAFKVPEVAPPHSVTARPVNFAAGGGTVVAPHVETQESIPAAGEAPERETEDA